MVTTSGRVLEVGLQFKAKPKLFLTYNNSLVLDGVGAQIQRIVSVYGVSRLINASYLHSPLIDFDPQIFTDSTHAERLKEIDEWNSLFRKDLFPYTHLQGDLIFHTNNISVRQLRILNFLSRFSKRRIICKMGNPRKITDSFPDILNTASELVSPIFSERELTKGSEIFKIVVHIRQGVLALSQFNDRLLPLSHYEKILVTVTRLLDSQGIQYQILIPQEGGQTRNLSIANSNVIQSMAIDPDNRQVRVNNDGTVTLMHESPELESSPMLFKAKWLDPSSAFFDFELMLKADLLVTSKSSFSFLAGLINQRAIKIYAPFWHSSPSEWISAENLDLDKLIKKFGKIQTNKIYPR